MLLGSCVLMVCDAGCAQVTDEFKQGQWLVSGNLTNEKALPYGKLCGSKTFKYTATYGPFKACGKKKVRTAQQH